MNWHFFFLSKCYCYTGITSIFEVSSHLNTMPSRVAGRIHLAHWHPVGIGSGGGTIIRTLSFRWTTPITLTVLPSLMYLLSPKTARVGLDLEAKQKKKNHIFRDKFLIAGKIQSTIYHELLAYKYVLVSQNFLIDPLKHHSLPFSLFY